MGSHRSPEDMLASVEAGAVTGRARALADDMNRWLQFPDQACACHRAPMQDATSDLVEWCRSARDVLEAVARG